MSLRSRNENAYIAKFVLKAWVLDPDTFAESVDFNIQLPCAPPTFLLIVEALETKHGVLVYIYDNFTHILRFKT